MKLQKYFNTKKKNYFTFFVIITFLISATFIVKKNNISLGYIKRSMPGNLQLFYREKILVFQNQKKLELELHKRVERITNYSKTPSFYFSEEKKLLKSVNEKDINYDLKIYTNPIFTLLGPRAYFAKNEDNLFLMNGVGLIYYMPLDQLSSNKLNFKRIKSNILELIDPDYGLGTTVANTRHVLIKDNRIYVSFIKKKKEVCFTNVVLVSDLNLDSLKFEKFFDTNECSPVMSVGAGGTLSNYKDNKIIMSIGDWLSGELVEQDNRFQKREVLAQDKNSLLGKTIAIDIESKNIEILSMGHRNHMGVFYDKENDQIFLSENGPNGGDEINLISDLDSKDVKNFGWPLASYGEHYGYDSMKFADQYKRAPLYKSHSEYAFEEPLMHFTPSVAPTQIIKTEKFEKLFDKHILYMGALAFRQKGLSLHKVVLNKDYQVEDHYIIQIGDRVRDVMYIENINKIILFLEISGSIAILTSYN